MVNMEPIARSSRDFVGSLAKGLSVISVFNDGADKLTVSDVAKIINLPRASARRQLLTLYALGYMKTDGKYFSLSPKILELGFSYLKSQSWISVATPVLRKLRDELDESVSMTVLEDTEVVYVQRFPVDRVMTMSMDIGSRKPAFCTAMGRVLLGELPETKIREILGKTDIKSYTKNTLVEINDITDSIIKAHENGYCLIDRELEQSLVAISVPLRNHYGEILAAVNVCGHPSNLSIDYLEGKCLEALKIATEQISKVLV